MLDEAGKVPLPPYIERDADQEDFDAYQTVFAKHRGAVAAPTASLHFSGEMMKEIKTKGIQVAEVTLHVGPGTFKPVEVENALELGVGQLRSHEAADDHENQGKRPSHEHELLLGGLRPQRAVDVHREDGGRRVEHRCE